MCSLPVLHPMLLNPLQPPKSYLFTAVIWLCAVVGIAGSSLVLRAPVVFPPPCTSGVGDRL